MRYGSLFSGIGGFDLGLDRAGMECAWQVETNDYCLQVLQKHWPDVPKYKDVKNVGKKNLEPVELICGGFPCQPHSQAGKRRGSADDRDLWPEYRRIIGELRSAWVIIENVPGIKTTILDQMLSDLENLLYATETLIVPACGVNAPHRRNRVFILAFSEGLRLQGNRDYREQVAMARQPKEESQRRQSSMAHSNGHGRHEMEQQIASRAIIKGSVCAFEQPGCRGKWWSIESRLGGTPDGLSAGMDEYWNGDWERNTPRVKADVPHRRERLKALGNAVVPAVAEWIGRQIMKVEES